MIGDGGHEEVWIRYASWPVCLLLEYDYLISAESIQEQNSGSKSSARELKQTARLVNYACIQPKKPKNATELTDTIKKIGKPTKKKKNVERTDPYRNLLQ